MKKEYELLVLRNQNPQSGLTESENPAVFTIILFVFVIFVISVSKYDLTGIIVYASFPVFSIIALGIPFRLILKRLVLLSPFVIIMAAVNPIVDQRAFIAMGNIIVSAGVISALVIIGKSLITMTAVMIFFSCVPFFKFCSVLKGFRVPDVFVTQLMLLYRYSFLLADEACALQKARNMRSFGKKGKDMLTTAKLIGSLLLRTKDRANRVFRAMVARGFQENIGKTEIKINKAKDWIFITGTVLLFSFVRIVA